MEPITLHVPPTMLEAFAKQAAAVKAQYRKFREELADANDTIDTAFDAVEREHREVEDEIETLSEMATDIQKALIEQCTSAGCKLEELRQAQPELYDMINSWNDVGRVEDLDFTAEIDTPKLELELPFLQPETPAEMELRKQVDLMRKSAQKIEDSRRVQVRKVRDGE